MQLQRPLLCSSPTAGAIDETEALESLDMEKYEVYFLDHENAMSDAKKLNLDLELVNNQTEELSDKIESLKSLVFILASENHSKEYQNNIDSIKELIQSYNKLFDENDIVDEVVEAVEGSKQLASNLFDLSDEPEVRDPLMHLFMIKLK